MSIQGSIRAMLDIGGVRALSVEYLPGEWSKDDSISLTKDDRAFVATQAKQYTDFIV